MFARELALQLVNNVLRAGARPRLHPNGFIQLDLTVDGTIHLHVWPDPPLDLPGMQKTKHPIHDHCFVMESIVLKGCITNLLYRKRVALGDPATIPVYRSYRAHNIAHEGGPDDTVLLPYEGDHLYCLEEASAQVVKAGESYYMPAMELHDSRVEGLTVTLMTKASVVRGYRPRIAVPLPIEPDNSFRREAVSADILEGHISKALDL